MQHNFIYQNPTKIYFGKNALSYLPNELKKYGSKVLLAYGGGSIKAIGLYDQVKEILSKAGKEVFELAGIMPNPTYTKMMEGARLVKEHNIEFILAVGGGSVIDCAKAISVSAHAQEDPWTRFWVQQAPVTNLVIPIGTILTMVGTASEMNGGSVITNEACKRKVGRVFPPAVYPKFSICNPTYTYSVSNYQMVSGIYDTLSHIMENYFSGDINNVSDHLAEALMKSVIYNARIAIKNPTSYEARSNLMWAATLGLNQLLSCSKEGDWQVHAIEHQLGAYTDCAHGMGLAAISLPYYRYIYQGGLDKFVRYALEVWHIDPNNKTKDEVALEGIAALEAFMKECGIATTLKELGATKDMLPLIAKSTVARGHYKKMDQDAILAILEACYE